MSKYNALWEFVQKNGSPQIKLTFDEIYNIARLEIDHSFLNYKKELNQYGYQVGKISLKDKTVIFTKLFKLNTSYKLEELNVFESRCGVLCNTCKRKEQVNCKGCINMSAPFWGGECKVKSCCEEKALNHCGECYDFPCDILANMGKEHGFDPTIKIEQCKKWLSDLHI